MGEIYGQTSTGLEIRTLSIMGDGAEHGEGAVEALMAAKPGSQEAVCARLRREGT